jgi:hypothetical protein
MRPSSRAVVGPLEPTVRRLACWWFGCQPDYEALRHDCEAVPCERCGAPDTAYADRCGDTRHARMVDRLRRLRWRLLDSWRPKPCPACGGRNGCRAECDGIPF